ncbi:iron chelate uptake ABC transporter family permease subunit [Kineosporia mesophila]|uniref:Iron chelate uptake ABC transporter family permease subunit n=1 Tax=Kineosporia mesophila TaxID=566012 RepID=A0ABP7AAQ9_9ACTN|nr:iron chelate uptake ABC transporter family permease subunit [Kineosporia mesophila]MCD5351430.1 iron chelate uptake ABC transporter family permease subunit [Kineosporia mesophila]
MTTSTRNTRRRPTIRSRSDALSVRISPRAIVVGTVFALIATTAGIIALTTGDFPIPVADVAATLLGNGDPGTTFVINELRLPRILTGLLVGTALAVSGAIFQSVSGNVLGSPDILGFTSGAATGAITVLLVLHGTTSQATLGALLGGAATGAAVYALSYRHGLAGPRLILIGISFQALLASVNSYLITRASLGGAVTAKVWLIGSLDSRSWEQVRPLVIALALLLPLALYLGRSLAYLEMGTDTAKALGIDVERRGLALIAIGTALAAVATAAAGPIGFVALTAAPLARRLTGSSSPPLLTTALAGAALVTVADLAAKQLFSPTQLPVGIATAAIGGIYLATLLVQQRRRT